MILIGVGANLPNARYGEPIDTCAAALRALETRGIAVPRRSRWYRSAPVPPSDQPWFINAVAVVETDLEPAGLLAVLHDIERDFGRTRRTRDEARVIDLDLLAYGRRVSAPGEVPALPHPRLAERAFVLLPLLEIAREWHHPRLGLAVGDLVDRLPPDQVAEPIP